MMPELDSSSQASNGLFLAVSAADWIEQLSAWGEEEEDCLIPARLIGWNSALMGQCQISAMKSCPSKLCRPHAGPRPKGAAC